MAHTVFISHSSSDKLTADAACAALEAQRIPCWIAPRDILPGVEFGEAIIDALTECKIVLLIFSELANKSPQVRREIERAVAKEKIIITFRIQNVMPDRAMEFALSNTHWLDALTPPLEVRLREICNTVGRLLSRPEPPHPTPDVPDPKPGPAPAPDDIRICPQCGRQRPASNLHCPVDGARLGPPHPPFKSEAPAPAPTTTNAQIYITAKPKLDLGTLNSMDANSVGVEINSSTYEMGWGQRSFQVPAGGCTVRVGIKNPLFRGLRSIGSVNLNLREGEASYLRYTSGFTLFQTGSLVEDRPAAPMPPVATPMAQPGRKLCPRCGADMPERAVFCPRCAAKQT